MKHIAIALCIVSAVVLAQLVHGSAVPSSAAMTGPAYDGSAVTVDVTFSESRGLYVGTGGDISAVMANGTTLVFKSVPSGSLLPVRATKVNSANTTASNMLALW